MYNVCTIYEQTVNTFIVRIPITGKLTIADTLPITGKLTIADTLPITGKLTFADKLPIS